LKHFFVVKRLAATRRLCGAERGRRGEARSASAEPPRRGYGSRRVDAEQDGAVLDRLLVLDQDLGDDAGAAGGDFVEDLHRFDLADDGGGCDFGTNVHIRLGVGLGPRVEGADRLALDLDPLGRRRGPEAGRRQPGWPPRSGPLPAHRPRRGAAGASTCRASGRFH